MTTYLSTSSYNRPWDDGIRWHLEQSADEAPDLENMDPLRTKSGFEFVRDQHLRVANGELEDEYILWLIKASYRQACRYTNRSLVPETWRQVMSGFVWGDLVLMKAPLISVGSIAYVDSGGADGELAGSPAEYEVDAPVGPNAGRGRIRMLNSAGWPSAWAQGDAVVVRFTAGYEAGEDGVAAIPEDITDGRLLWIAERYKQRSLTDHAFNQNKAAIQARQLWMDYRIY